MSAKTFKSIAILFFLNLLLPCCAATGPSRPPAVKNNLSEIKADCSLCHPSTDGAGGVLRKPVSELCRECHPERMATSEHKIDVVPSVVVPQLPLQEGKMGCTTCHDPHSNTNRGMLRVPAGQLCTLCHKYQRGEPRTRIKAKAKGDLTRSHEDTK